MTANFDSENQPLEVEKHPNDAVETEKLIPWVTPRKPIAAWRLFLPLLFQSALILAIPAQSAYTYFTGRTVILQTAPVDPYDFLRGYYQTLSYEISTVNTLQKLPGGKELFSSENNGQYNLPIGSTIYVILESPKASSKTVPPAWKPVGVSGDRPTNLPDNQIALQGRYQGWRIEYGLESYYMPEDQREQINEEVNEAQTARNATNQAQPFVVEVKIDQQGHAVPVSLWVQEQNYRF